MIRYLRSDATRLSSEDIQDIIKANTRQTSKNRQKSACRFLAIFGDFCPIFGDFLSDFMARIAKKSEILFF